MEAEGEDGRKRKEREGEDGRRGRRERERDRQRKTERERETERETERDREKTRKKTMNTFLVFVAFAQSANVHRIPFLNNAISTGCWTNCAPLLQA